MHGTIDRDLASTQLWQRSLERSRRRRVLAEDARKEIGRRKTTTFALTAAVAAAPISPSVVAAVDLSKNHVDKRARSLDRRHIERILLTYGDRGSSVAQLQQSLHIPADGIFGPQTRAAVRAFQEQTDLPVTGEVNVRTWLTLFPTDMIVYAPPGTSSALGVNHNDGPQWAAVSGPQGHAQLASGKHHKATAHAAALFGGGQAATQGDAPDGAPPVSVPPVGGAPTGGGVPTGGGGPVGGGPAPAPPSFHFPTGGSVGDMISTMMSAARQIDRQHYAYSWGGGHNSSFSGPYDCSGAVSAVLHAAGLLSAPRVSGGFMHWGAPGPGAVTLYANAGHVYMSILGHYFGTSMSNPGGGAGWFKGGPRPGFAVVHVPFSKLHLRRHRRHHRHHRRHRRHATTQQPQNGSQPTNQQPAQPDTTAPKQTTTSDPTTKSSTTEQQSGTTQSSGTQTAVSQPVQQAPSTQQAPAPQPTSAPVASGQTQAQAPVTPSTQVTPQAAPAPAPQPVSAAPTPAAVQAKPPVSAPQTPSRGFAPGQQGAVASAGAPGKAVSAEADAGHPATPVKAGQQNDKK